MNSIIQRNKNVINKVCSAITRNIVPRESTYSHGIPLSEHSGMSCSLNVKWVVYGGKVYPEVEGDRVYFVWDPKIKTEGVDMDKMGSFGSGDPFGDIKDKVAYEVLRPFTSNYNRKYNYDGLMEILNSSGVKGVGTVSDLLALSNKEIEDIIKKTVAYRNVTGGIDYYNKFIPEIVLEPSVHKRLKRRNVIPLAFWESTTNAFSWPKRRIDWDEPPMTNKNRAVFTLDEVIANCDRVAKGCVDYTPYRSWVYFIDKTPDGRVNNLEMY